MTKTAYSKTPPAWLSLIPIAIANFEALLTTNLPPNIIPAIPTATNATKMEWREPSNADITAAKIINNRKE